MSFLDLPEARFAEGVVRVPGSKSISNRVLLLAALAEGETLIRDVLDSDDTARMLDALEVLGVSINRDDGNEGGNDYRVHGIAGQSPLHFPLRFPIEEADLYLGNAGTVFRPLTAVLSLTGGRYRLSGSPRMHERPIGDLVDALRQMGANITYCGAEGFPPLQIMPADIHAAGVTVRGDVSSQFLTGLLMALPLCSSPERKPLTISVTGELISRPYIEITLALMARFGVTVEREGWHRFILPSSQHYRSPREVRVEGDASSASYFLAAGAIATGPVRVEGIGLGSLQGDVRFADALEQMGAQISKGEDWIEAQAPESGRLRAIDLDCNAIPDAAMTLAVLALFADGTTKLRNIASWRVKETDRLAAVAHELRKLGAKVEEGRDSLTIHPPPMGQFVPHASIETYDDHRMAMCFSLASFGAAVRINDPGCVSKTFPGYFDKFTAITET